MLYMQLLETKVTLLTELRNLKTNLEFMASPAKAMYKENTSQIKPTK